MIVSTLPCQTSNKSSIPFKLTTRKPYNHNEEWSDRVIAIGNPGFGKELQGGFEGDEEADEAERGFFNTNWDIRGLDQSYDKGEHNGDSNALTT